MKFTIVIPVLNNLEYTIPCIQSVFDHTKDFELIVIDNGSTDETPNYLQSLIPKHTNVKVATFDKNEGFAKACNTGLEAAKGDYIILLNNDTIVTPAWADQLVDAIPIAEQEYDVKPIGIIGPRTNYAGGAQSLQADPYTMEQLPQAAIEHHQAHKDKTQLTGFISGLCMLITRPCLKHVGLLDERFKIGGVEDTEFCLRSQLKGWKLAIDDSTYIHHHGSKTIAQLKEPYAPIHQSNHLRFVGKYYDDKPKKLIVTIRVRNQLELLKKAITRNSLFADEIIILADRCTEYHAKILEALPKVNQVIEQNETNSPAASETGHGWDLFRDRSLLMQAAIDKGADWIFALDADEILEDSFTYDYVHKLMNPMDPNILAYGFDFCTFFLGHTHYRTDGIFGRMRGVRMWRVLPNQHPRMVRKKRRCCLHCPAISTYNTRHIRTRVKHYGYETPKICQQKFDFYTHLDPNPDKGYIGPEGYNHLIAPTLVLQEWKEKNDLALSMIVRDEEINLFKFLATYATYFDQIVIVDTGSKDHTKTVAQTFGADVYDFHWTKDFSAARNFAKSKCNTTWIMSMDPDEDIDLQDLKIIYQMIQEDVDAWLFQVMNFQKDNTIIYSDNTRLLRNIPEIYWSFRVHEKISPAVKKHGLTVLPAPFKIKHFGHLKDDSIQDQKTKDYAHMLKKQLRETPDDAAAHFHYAFHEFKKGKEHKGMHLLEKTLQLQPDFFMATKELSLIHLTKAADYFQNLLDTIPHNHYFYPWVQRVHHTVQQALNTKPD